MSIGVFCKTCNKSVRVREELTGKRAKCPACGQLLLIAEADTPLGQAKDRPRRRKSAGKRVASGAAGPAGGGVVQPEIHFAVLLWDVASGSPTRCTGHTADISSVAFSPKGNQVVSAAGHRAGAVQQLPGLAADNSIRIWDAKGGKQIAVCAGHAGGTQQAVFSPDGKQILSGGEDNKLRLWDAKTGKEMAALPGHGKAVLAVAISPDGKRALSAARYESVILWDLEQRKVLTRFANATARSVAFSGDGGLALIADGSEIRVYRLREQ